MLLATGRAGSVSAKSGRAVRELLGLTVAPRMPFQLIVVIICYRPISSLFRSPESHCLMNC
jgi:hypothetical protein